MIFQDFDVRLIKILSAQFIFSFANPLVYQWISMVTNAETGINLIIFTSSHYRWLSRLRRNAFECVLPPRKPWCRSDLYRIFAETRDESPRDWL